jgi:putative oxidoreductase
MEVVFMSYGLLALRVVVGLVMAAHGAQKIFGWFGGGGPRGTAGVFEQLRFRVPLGMALAAGAAELGGGLLLATGLLTPFAALAVAIVMLNAIGVVHWPRGFWNTNGGYEFNLVILTVAVALAATGAGRFSLDAAVGWADNISGLWWAVAVGGAAALTAAMTLTLGRRGVSLRRLLTGRRTAEPTAA